MKPDSIASSLDLGIDINCPFDRASAFLAEPENFMRWASGMGNSLRREREDWVVQTPQGPMRVRFTPANPFGVLDHYVIPAHGKSIYIPLRVIANGEGCHVTLTLFRLPEMDDQRFDADAAWVRKDLATLKTVLEQLGD